jgi:hypothetical protein
MQRLRLPHVRMFRKMRLFLLVLIVTVATFAQDKPNDDFSITIERIGCLGSCPDYRVTIHEDGSVRYEGRAYAQVEGVRRNTIARSSVQKLVRDLRNEEFFKWEEKKEVCVDYPEVIITVDLHGQHNRVIEGCNTPGKVLKLAGEIDRISGAKRWIGKAH